MIVGELLVAFTASFAFGVIFNVSRSELIFCGVAGLISEGVYWLVMYNEGGAALAAAAAAGAVTAASRTFANVRKMPVTVYLISGILPLVPGAGMYNTVYGIIASDYINAMYTAIDTLKVASAVAIGIIFVFALPNKLFLKK